VWEVIRDLNPWRFRVDQIVHRSDGERPLLVGTLTLGEGIGVGDPFRVDGRGTTGFLLSLDQEHQGQPGCGLSVDIEAEVGDELVRSSALPPDP
jgi:hypothetical protein